MRGVAYRPRQRVLLAARLECRLAAGSRPGNGDERRSLVLWAVRKPTSHWGLCLFVFFVSVVMLFERELTGKVQACHEEVVDLSTTSQGSQ